MVLCYMHDPGQNKYIVSCILGIVIKFIKTIKLYSRKNLAHGHKRIIIIHRESSFAHLDFGISCYAECRTIQP